MKLLTIKQAAKELNVSVACLRDLARKGRIPAYKVGRDWRIMLDEVLDVTCNLNDFEDEEHV